MYQPGGQVDLVLHRLLGRRDRRGQVAPTHVGLHRDLALDLLPADLGGPGGDAHVSELAQRHPRPEAAAVPIRERDGQVGQRLQVIANAGIETGLDVKTSLPLDHRAHRAAADGLDHVQDILDVEAQPGDGLPVDLDGQGRQPEGLLGLDLLHAFDTADHRRDLVCDLAHLFEGAAARIDLDAHV